MNCSVEELVRKSKRKLAYQLLCHALVSWMQTVTSSTLYTLYLEVCPRVCSLSLSENATTQLIERERDKGGGFSFTVHKPLRPLNGLKRQRFYFTSDTHGCQKFQSWALAVFLVVKKYKVPISFKPIPCTLFLRQSYLKSQSPVKLS